MRGRVLWLLIALFTEGCEAPANMREVRWTPALRLESLEDLTRRLEEPWGTPLNVTRRGVESGEAVIVDCISYFDLTAKGFEATPFKYQRNLGADCHALRALRQAVPARRSYVAEFILDAGAIDKLPPTLSLAISNDELRAVEAADAKGLSWPAYESITRVTPQDEYTLLVEGDGWAVRIQIYAWGDFNGDGLEDLLFKTLSWLTQGSYESTRLVLLTRTRDGVRLDLVKEYEISG